MKPASFTLLVLACLLLARVSHGAPTAEAIIAQVAARSAEAEKRKQEFAYQRLSRVDYLDDQGGLKKKVVRLYQVTPVNGKPVSRLVEVNGRPPTAEQETRRSAARETGDKTRGLALGEDLLGRFDYHLRGEETHGDRKMWVLSFMPKRGVESSGFIDRLINSMHGTIWVDQEDYDFARVHVQLSRKVSFFGGLAGAIERLDLQLVQKRVDPAVWFTEALSLDFAGRKLFSPIRFRCYETCSDFRKMATVTSAPAPSRPSVAHP